jgi:DNA-binding LacI/PurR family transcriptional regulator
MKKIVVIVCSFGKRADEPNPVNMRLGSATRGIINELRQKGYEPIVVAQWEVARWLDQHQIHVDRVVKTKDAIRGTNGYLDSEDVIRTARAHVGLEVEEAVVVANPFIHLGVCRRIARRHGFNIMDDMSIPNVGFDNAPEQLQWWCKGKARLLSYGAIVKAGGLVKIDLHGIGER